MKGGNNSNNNMMNKLNEISCDPICGFSVRSHNASEAIDLAYMHGKKSHPNMKISKSLIKKMVKKV